MSFVSTTISDDGTSCLMIGNGDPNVNSITLLGSCTNGAYINTHPIDSPGLFVWQPGTAQWDLT